jgi:signal transduction histidine kinase/DNA-binding response OmpR family regulator
VVADIMMPRLDGLELLAAMRDDPDTRDIPVILLSARAGEDARVEGLRAGADDYLVKPFGANELVARVASIVQLSRLRRQGEERLADANRELRRHLLEQQTLLDVLPVGIGIATDRECRDIRINRAFAATLGLPAAANASKTAPADNRPTNFRVLTPGGVEIPDEQLPMQVAAREGREVNDVEVDIVHNDGRVVRLLEYAAPLFDEQGAPRGAIGAFVDVTASHRARRTLARSEERFRRIFDTAGVSIWEQDFSAVKAALDSLVREGVDDLARYLSAHPEFVDHCAGLVRIIDVNSASLRMFGAPDKDALLESLERVFAPETRTIFAGALVALARGDRRYEAETALRTLDGRSIHALMTMTFPVPGESFESVLVSLADITDRKRIENSLRRNEMLFREMANALQQEVAVRTTLAQVGASLAGELNPDRLVQAVTDAATELTTAEFGAFSYRLRDEKGESRSLRSVSGVLPETVSGFAPFQAADVFGPILRGEAIVRVNDVTQDPRYERYAPVPPGGRPVRSYLAVPVVAHGGQVVGGLFFGHTRPGVFTARHEQLASGVAAWAAIALDNARLYRDVEEANRLKDEFLATLSHELRTPLNAVLGWAQMLRAGIVKPSMQKRALESLERNARVQAQLVEDLLDVSRIISGKLHLKVEAVDIATIIANAVDTVRAGAAAKRLHLEVVFERDRRLLVTGDPDRLQQIVWNLVSNAIKFTPIGGRIDVELRQIDSRAEIVVRDTGQGIAPSFQPFVFERFRQMDGSTARPHGGLGLGLSIVRHLTEAHGGTVSAESAGENQGATFRVRLPLRAVNERDGSAPARSAGQSPRALAGVRALVVGDEPDARELVRYVLEARGARVWTAASAGEALRLAGRSVFDVLIADIAMSEQDGYSLIRALRGLSTEAQRAIPAIAVTAYPGVHERDEALEAGYTGHLAKPVDPDELVDAVSAAIDGASHRGRPGRKRAARARTQKPKRRRG